VYDSVDVACKSVGVLAQYGNYLKSYHAKTNFVLNWGAKAKPEGDDLISKARIDGRQALLEHEAKQLLHMHGAQTQPEFLVVSADDAVKAAASINGPVAMKIVSPDILHKSDAKGVLLHLKTKTEIEKGYGRLMKNAKHYNAQADIRGVLISPMVPPGVEVIIGTEIDDQFGPIIMYGLGGVMVEILKDVSFRVLPISRFSAKKMIGETKSAPILDGVRGTQSCDKKALLSLLLLISDIVEAYPDIQEMDLNPVIIHEKGLSIVDARILLKEKCFLKPDSSAKTPCKATAYREEANKEGPPDKERPF
jgi:acetyltransferase